MWGASCLHEFWEPQLLSTVIIPVFQTRLLEEEAPVPAAPSCEKLHSLFCVFGACRLNPWLTLAHSSWRCGRWSLTIFMPAYWLLFSSPLFADWLLLMLMLLCLSSMQAYLHSGAERFVRTYRVLTSALLIDSQIHSGVKINHNLSDNSLFWPEKSGEKRNTLAELQKCLGTFMTLHFVNEPPAHHPYQTVTCLN